MALPLDGLLVGIKKIKALGVLLATAARDTALDFGAGLTTTYDSATDTVTVSMPGAPPPTAGQTAGEVLVVKSDLSTAWEFKAFSGGLAPRQVVADGWAPDDSTDGCYRQTDISSAKAVYFPLALGAAKLTFLSVTLAGGSVHASLPATLPTATLQVKTYSSYTGESAWTDVPNGTITYVSAADPANYHLACTDYCTPNLIPAPNALYRLKVTGETGTNSATGLKVLDIYASGEIR